MASPAQFYDNNGELRLDGTLVGGGSPLTVLGPFPFAFDDPDIQTIGVALSPLAAASSLIRAWAIATVGWVWDTTGSITLGVGSLADWQSDSQETANYDAGSPGGGAVFHRELRLGGSAVAQHYSYDILQAAMLNVGVFPNTTVSAGAANAYALLWTP